MALWGLTDNLAGAPKWLTTTESFVAGDVTTGSNSITIAGHSIVNGTKVVLAGATANALGSSTDGVHFAKVVGDVITLHPTHTAPSTFGTAIGLSSQAAGTLQVIPSDVDVAVAKAASTKANVFFIDEAEAETASNRAKGFKTGGWYKYETYADSGSVTRHKAELLCAISQSGHASQTDTGVDTEATENDVVAGGNALISIGTHPITDGTDATNSAKVNLAGDENIVLITAATVAPSGGTISYQWQQKLAAAGSEFTDLTAGGVYAITATTGSTSTLTISTTNNLAGAQYRCVVSHPEADDVTSNVATATQE